MTNAEKQVVREKCLDRALDYWKIAGGSWNEVDLMRTARHFYDYIVDGKEDIDDNN